MDCCDVNGLNRTFRARTARADRRHYLRRGLDDRQRALLDFPLDNVSHLDIGCGIGALGLTGLNGGMTSSYFVDVSEAYLDTARQLATETGVEERASFLQGDAAHLELPEVDLVTLDRVVCCYPDARGPPIGSGPREPPLPDVQLPFRPLVAACPVSGLATDSCA